MSDMDKLDGLTGTLLSTTASLAALIIMLKQKNILSEDDEREMNESALLLLETRQGDDPKTNHIYEIARAIIESQLGAEP